MITKTEAIAILEKEKKNTACSDIHAAYDMAIKYIRASMVMAPRWKTYKSNKEFWNAIDAWVNDPNNMGKNLDDLTAYLLEEIDISEDQ